MIQVENLTKRYGSRTAIDGVSFEVEKGEILGFLGPNGAGKTTTMRILSGFFPATEGRAVVAGFDVSEQPLEAKRRTGYLPENPPVYTEMDVTSYLRFVARIKGVKSADVSRRASYAMERCGLSEHEDRLIKHLSKGYRQRVGLAQALIHDPDVLILDEPTIGLDPKQIIEVRELIRSLAGDHTVILSTHILPEVSMTCERVIIINNGKIVAVDTPQNLTHQLAGGTRVEVEVSGPMEQLSNVLTRIEGVGHYGTSAASGDRFSLSIEAEDHKEIRPAIARELVKNGFDVYSIRMEAITLEEVFLKLTTEEETE
ncbi:MAG: ABC transporter ATP-binding protein [Acidobacteriota bacterium]|nr:MAG: ABC transporter ATP-binding protein [Acidobacteriota bacterium]